MLFLLTVFKFKRSFRFIIQHDTGIELLLGFAFHAFNKGCSPLSDKAFYQEMISKDYWEQTHEIQSEKKEILLQIKDYEE